MSPSIAVCNRLIPLDRLAVRPDRARPHGPGLRRALARHIEASGAYPALIVRPVESDRFEVLDGALRLEVLRRQGAPWARCEVWAVDDEGAVTLAATLNTLRSRPPARTRQGDYQALAQVVGESDAAELLGLTPSARRALECGGQTAPPRHGPAPALRAVVFHLPPDDARRLDSLVRRLAGGQGRSVGMARLIRRAGAPSAR